MRELHVVRKSRVHGKGVFAKCDIEPGSKVIQYKGKKVTRAQSNRIAEEQMKKASKNPSKGQVYIFTLNSRYDLDGNYPDNDARLINHSCDPNCETDIVKGEVWISAIRPIKKGEELTYNYGFDFDKDDYKDHVCKCGSKHCIGCILAEEDWKKLARHLKKLDKKRALNKVIKGIKANKL